MTAYIASMLFVVLAEMGDKTQLLAMAFAARYPWRTVMWGVFVATIFNHLFAVVVGNYLTAVVPLGYIKLAAAASFVVFGLWTIRGDSLDGEDEKTGRSPFWTVAVAFFIAEMGDKTQLATVALAAQYSTIIPVWLGTTTGMLIADAIGIVFGIVMGKKIPERAVKWFAAIVFIAFGLAGLYEALPAGVVTLPVAVAAGVSLAAAMYAVARWGNSAGEEKTAAATKK
ncbi:TMEM165/GDT1 family protein [Anaeroselena agilis]|uniref:GDT1 family protein n=1 Tax=Anaeroselena agilis TaxID=3063788 RepID=A0ABU3P388_9FIRM|nr:TMEM165/GDT1 family protein [Selenomonadales bacterium 4137-cl]